MNVELEKQTNGHGNREGVSSFMKEEEPGQRKGGLEVSGTERKKEMRERKGGVKGECDRAPSHVREA